ncbi:MAG TPA: DEAD/DEAH box helicase [Patescibacteria group bacterium]|nr:DEAD/DEAH box helicase [Patescibacteria group bacterium]
MKNNFNDMGISPLVLKAIEEMGFEEPTEVQRKAIPHILNQEDLIVMSKTGSGKTAVFGVSMLQMIDPGMAGPQGLILTPTRELAVQVDSDLKQMSKHLPHKTTAVYGQHNMNIEIQTLKKGVSIVTGTPGRVHDHICHRNLDTKHIRFLVLDEADRMLDMGFLDQVVRIIKSLPKERVTLLFSATIPTEIHKICREYMKHPVTIEIESQTMTVDAIKQVYYRVKHNEKNLQLNRLLRVEQPESCMIFCNTRVTVDRVQSFLSRKGYVSHALHGDIPQGRRLKTIQQFKQGEIPLLVATDVAARGIHIDGLSLVINYDVPLDKDSYVHRIGRTGRAGKEGRAITLVTGDDIMSLYAIEEYIGVMIAEKELPTEAVFNEHSNRSSKVNTNHKTAKAIQTMHLTEQAKPNPAIAKLVPPQSEGQTELMQSQASAAKTSLLLRILKRIFDK